MQAAILSRLADYPQQAKQNMHQAAALLPCTLAAVLQHDPQLVSTAVETFYYRDEEDIKAARQMRHFHPDQVRLRYCTTHTCQREHLAIFVCSLWPKALVLVLAVLQQGSMWYTGIGQPELKI